MVLEHYKKSHCIYIYNIYIKINISVSLSTHSTCNRKLDSIRDALLQNFRPTCEGPNVAEGKADNVFDAGVDGGVFDQQPPLLSLVVTFRVSPGLIHRLQATAVLDVKGQANHLCRNISFSSLHYSHSGALMKNLAGEGPPLF